MKSYLGIDVHAIISACRFPSKVEAELIQFGEQTLSKPQRTRRKKSVIGTATIEARIYGITSSITTLFGPWNMECRRPVAVASALTA